jgi:hypothetical protein
LLEKEDVDQIQKSSAKETKLAAALKAKESS